MFSFALVLTKSEIKNILNSARTRLSTIKYINTNCFGESSRFTFFCKSLSYQQIVSK